MDAKQACDKLNGFNFQNRYLVGMYSFEPLSVRWSNLLAFLFFFKKLRKVC